MAQLGVRTCTVELAADHKCGVQTRFRQYAGHQTGGGGFAVSTRNRDALLKAHQLRKHQRARHHGNFARTGLQHFRVVRLHGRGSNHHVRCLHVGCIVPHESLNTQCLQPLQSGALRQVRAGDGIAEVVQDLCNTTHPRATQAHKMDVLNGVFHAASSSHAATTSRVA